MVGVSAQPLRNRWALESGWLAVAARLVTVVALGLIGVGLASASLQLDGYGLARSLPLAYYAGLALLPIASAIEFWRGRQCSAALIVLHVIAFVVIVWSTPLLLEGTPRFRTAYQNFADVDPLVRGDGLLPETFIYHNWPVFPVLMASLVSIGVPTLTLMGWFPVVISLLYLVPLVGLLWLLAGEAGRRVTPGATSADSAVPWAQEVGAARAGPAPEGVDDEATGSTSPSARDGRWLIALWIFPVFNWTGQDYFSPQALVYLLFLAWIAVLMFVAVRREGQFDLGTFATTSFLFTLIVMTHVLTSLFALGVLTALVIARVIRRPSVLLLCLLVFISWQAYVAAPFFTAYRDRLVETILDASNFFQANLSQRLHGSPEHEAIARIRIVVTAVIFAAGAFAALLLLRRRPLRTSTRFALAYLIAVAAVAPIAIYGGEMLIRVLLFSLPMIMVLIAQTFTSRRAAMVLAAGVCVMAPVHILTHYGNELYDYISPGELAGFEHAASLGPANIYGAYPAGRFLNTARIDTRNATVPRGEEVPRLADYEFPAAHHWREDQWPVYVAVSRGDVAAMTLFYDQPQFMGEVLDHLRSHPDFRLEFSNDDIAIFRWLGKPTTALEPR